MCVCVCVCVCVFLSSFFLLYLGVETLLPGGKWWSLNAAMSSSMDYAYARCACCLLVLNAVCTLYFHAYALQGDILRDGRCYCSAKRLDS